MRPAAKDVSTLSFVFGLIYRGLYYIAQTHEK
jgi:hypothetical protein